MNQTIKVSVDPDLEPLIAGFLQNRQKDVVTLQAALADGDMAAIQTIGHSLKGVGGGYGFIRITELGAGLESAARDNDMASISKQVDELAQYLTQIEVVYE